MTYRKNIGRVVYEAPVGTGVPKNDRFQVIGEYEIENFLSSCTLVSKIRFRKKNDWVATSVSGRMVGDYEKSSEPSSRSGKNLDRIGSIST
jgi:hypothetical protein